jgi:hypothetical protein
MMNVAFTLNVQPDSKLIVLFVYTLMMQPNWGRAVFAESNQPRGDKLRDTEKRP